MKAGCSAAVFAAMLAAHEAGDHVLQTEAQALGKATSWRAMAGHVGSYHAAQLAALAVADAALGLRLRPSRVAAAVTLSASTHALLDRRWPVDAVVRVFGHPSTEPGSWRSGYFDPPEHAHYTTGVSGPQTTRVPLHGPYLTDQSLHKLVLWACSLIAVSGGQR